MKELEYLEVIKNVLADSSLIGDDCAFLRNYDLCVTQDTLVEDVHFTLDTISPYELGCKSVQVNLSDLAASGSEPLYILISLSFPKFINENFIKNFYEGVNFVCENYDVKVAGGDLTSSDKVFVSISAIGKKHNKVKVTRNCAQAGDVIVTTGTHGDSAAGLRLLSLNYNTSEYLIKRHLLPVARIEQSRILLDTAIKTGVNSIALMDTSDGLGDAIYKLSKGCMLSFDIDFGSIPISPELKKHFPTEYKDFVLWGGEDYELLGAISPQLYEKLDKNMFFKIGVVSDKPFSAKDEEEFEKKCFKHFED